MENCLTDNVMIVLNALNGLVHKLTELGIKTECNLMGGINCANLVIIIKVVLVSTTPRQAINTPVIKMIQPV